MKTYKQSSRDTTNRRKKEGYRSLIIPTNIKENEGFEKHHITHAFIISIPSFLHHSLFHRFSYTEDRRPHYIDSSKSMREINKVVMLWLLGTWDEIYI